MLVFKEQIEVLRKRYEESEVELPSTRAELASMRKELDSKTEELNDRVISIRREKDSCYYAYLSE